MSKNTFVLLLLTCIGVYLAGVFMIPLMDIDAAQYASISREMLARNSFLQVFAGAIVGILFGGFIYFMARQRITGRLRQKKDDNGPI